MKKPPLTVKSALGMQNLSQQKSNKKNPTTKQNPHSNLKQEKKVPTLHWSLMETLEIIHDTL